MPSSRRYAFRQSVDVGAQISTVESVEREDLTPAEECGAYQHFIESDGDIDAVAIRFHKTRRFVEGRIRLANLAAPVFEALEVLRPTLWPLIRALIWIRMEGNGTAQPPTLELTSSMQHRELQHHEGPLIGRAE